LVLDVAGGENGSSSTDHFQKSVFISWPRRDMAKHGKVNLEQQALK